MYPRVVICHLQRPLWSMKSIFITSLKIFYQQKGCPMFKVNSNFYLAYTPIDDHADSTTLNVVWIFYIIAVFLFYDTCNQV